MAPPGPGESCAPFLPRAFQSYLSFRSFDLHSVLHLVAFACQDFILHQVSDGCFLIYLFAISFFSCDCSLWPLHFFASLLLFFCFGFLYVLRLDRCQVSHRLAIVHSTGAHLIALALSCAHIHRVVINR